jgi:hypothetical protein
VVCPRGAVQTVEFDGPVGLGFVRRWVACRPVWQDLACAFTRRATADAQAVSAAFELRSPTTVESAHREKPGTLSTGLVERERSRCKVSPIFASLFIRLHSSAVRIARSIEEDTRRLL